MEAPPLAAELRERAEAGPIMPADSWPPDPVPEKRTKPKTTLGWDGEWYEDEAKKRTHRELVLAGMERARQQGKRIGRPSVTEREGFPQRFEAVVERIRARSISRRRAARELAIGYATLKRLLDARPQRSDESGGDTPALMIAATRGKEDVRYDVPVALLTKSLNTYP